MKRPNILYIFTDQQSANAMSCAGNPHLRTPAMDRLAEQGVRFDRAYCSSPLCIPARMSMFTGRMPYELGVNVNCAQTPVPPPCPMLGRMMRDAGYGTRYIGKWHLTVPEAAGDIHGFEQIIGGGGAGGLDRDKADAACRFLREPHDRPFLLVVSFLNPHDCCELARAEPLRMAELPPVPDDETAWPPPPPNWQAPPGEPEAFRDFCTQHPRVYCAPSWDERETRRYRWGYNRLVETVDGDIGGILDALDASDAADNTVVIFSSDHGDAQGAHHLNQKWLMYDEIVRVPLILRAPGQHAGRRQNTLASATLDLMPTVLDYAGIEPPAALRGVSLKPLVEGRQPRLQRKSVASAVSLGTESPVGADDRPRVRMLRSDRYKYVAVDRGEHREQLFDLAEDPGEMSSLAGSPQHADALQEHRTMLRAWAEQTNDLGWLGRETGAVDQRP